MNVEYETNGQTDRPAYLIGYILELSITLYNTFIHTYNAINNAKNAMLSINQKSQYHSSESIGCSDADGGFHRIVMLISFTQLTFIVHICYT